MNTNAIPDHRSAWIMQPEIRRVRALGEDFDAPRRLYATYIPVLLAFTGILSWLVSTEYAMVVCSVVSGAVGCYMLFDWLLRGPTRFSALIALGLLLGYGVGSVNTWATTSRGGLTIGQYLGYNDGALARGIAAVAICCSMLIFLGEIFERPIFGRDFRFRPDERIYGLIYIGTVVILGSFATGIITFNGIAGSDTGDVGVFKTFLDWVFSPLTSVAVAAFMLAPRQTVRRKLSGVAALVLVILITFMGRRVIFYTVLQTLFMVRLSGFRLPRSYVKKFVIIALVLAFLIVGTLGFMLLRIAGYGLSGNHKSLADRLSLAGEWVREGTAIERAVTTSKTNVQTRTFMLGFFASVLEGSSTHTPGLGQDTIGLLQLAIPSALYPAKDKFFSEELTTDRLFGFGYVDEANSLMTNGATDFGLIGAVLYPILVAVVLRAFLELLLRFVDPFSALIFVLSATLFALASETAITAAADLLLHGTLFSFGLYLFFSLPRFRLQR